MVFHFSAVSYDRSESNRYQYYLEGYDNEWSQWTSETLKEYTNLSGGDYVFHVRSKNVYGELGNEDTFSFTILSPWYLSVVVVCSVCFNFSRVIIPDKTDGIKKSKQKT